MRVLLAAGTDPDAADYEGWAALHYATVPVWAAGRGHEEAVVALAEGGADLDKVDGDGATPLMEAMLSGLDGVVRRLLELGADHTSVGTSRWYKGLTALEVVEEEGKHAAAAVLKAWAGGTRDAAELDRLAAEAPTDEEDEEYQ